MESGFLSVCEEWEPETGWQDSHGGRRHVQTVQTLIMEKEVPFYGSLRGSLLSIQSAPPPPTFCLHSYPLDIFFFFFAID